MKKIQYCSLERESDCFKNTGTECIKRALTCQLPFTVLHFLICSACLTTSGRFTYTFEIQPSSGVGKEKKSYLFLCPFKLWCGTSVESCSLVWTLWRACCAFMYFKGLEYLPLIQDTVIALTSVRVRSVDWMFHTEGFVCYYNWITADERDYVAVLDYEGFFKHVAY